MTPAQAAAFFLFVPFLIGLLLGATGAGVASYFTWGVGILFWTMSSIGVWACLYVGFLVAERLLRPWAPPLALSLMVGAVIGSLFGRYIVFGMAHLLSDQMLHGRTPRPVPGFEASVSFWMYFLQGWAGVYLAWLVAGLVFDRWLQASNSMGAVAEGVSSRTERPAEALQAPSGKSAAEPAAQASSLGLSADAQVFLSRLPFAIRNEVIALEAADHYVRVHRPGGSLLLHGRLSDAVDAMSYLGGARVHRSWWVRCDAIRASKAFGRRTILELSNGLLVPVSSAWREVARSAGVPLDTRRCPTTVNAGIECI